MGISFTPFPSSDQENSSSIETSMLELTLRADNDYNDQASKSESSYVSSYFSSLYQLLGITGNL